MNILKTLTNLCPIVGKILGALFVLIGLILILINVPGWFWTFLIGVILIVLGILIWRFLG